MRVVFVICFYLIKNTLGANWSCNNAVVKVLSLKGTCQRNTIFKPFSLMFLFFLKQKSSLSQSFTLNFEVHKQYKGVINEGKGEREVGTQVQVKQSYSVHDVQRQTNLKPTMFLIEFPCFLLT